ncbi:MAG: transcriptional regulator [Firmicutes bacterium HGW-Firmicutes-8]|nr:MAG: transcriptional regulator [Firmicutes bacterium HGW-Firmicutes-8]
MDLVRIGGKIISRRKISRMVDQILEMRSTGVAQQEIANRLGVDRTFVSRLETLGEVRKGNRIAVVGFPIKNKDEILDLLQREGIEFTLIMTENERWDFVKKAEGIDLLNRIMSLIAEARSFDVVFVIGSNQRIKIIEAILDKEVVGLEIGESPIEEDKYVEPAKVLEILHAIKLRAFQKPANIIGEVVR